MKNLLFITAIVLCALQLKAQQFKSKPADTLKIHPFKPDFKLRNPAQLFNPKFNFDYNFGVSQPSPFSAFYIRMPVVVLSGESHMPVVHLDGSSNMPVKPIGSENLAPIRRNALPGMPAFTNPGS